MYSFKNKPTNSTLWEHSQTYDIEFHKSYKRHEIDCFVYQTKLFLFNNGLITQWDLSTMTIEMQYNVNVSDNRNFVVNDIVVNKNQTLLALHDYQDKKTDIYSMETGMWISRYG